jgi:hypothetical protein
MKLTLIKFCYIRRIVLLLVVLIIVISMVKIIYKGNEQKSMVKPNFNEKENIFFIETAAFMFNSLDVVTEPAELRVRQACSIESAALLNPNSQVFVILANRLNVTSSKLTETLMEYQNVVFLPLNVAELSVGSPVEDWLKSEKLFASRYIIQNVSDLLRVLVLWKYE